MLEIHPGDINKPAEWEGLQMPEAHALLAKLPVQFKQSDILIPSPKMS